MHPAQFMVTAMQIPHKSMFDHVCMFSLANRHVIVRSLKLPRFLVSLFYSCSEYMTILTLIQFNSATLCFSLFLSLSLSLPVSPSVKTAMWGVASPFMPPKKHDRLRRKIYTPKNGFDQAAISCLQPPCRLQETQRPRYLKYPGVFLRIWMGSFVTCDVCWLLNDFALW